MQVKEVVRTAVDYVADLYSAEDISHIGLEEVEFDDRNALWSVTVGFARKWDYPSGSLVGAFAHLAERPYGRTYKTVVVRDSDGQVTAIRIRELGAIE